MNKLVFTFSFFSIFFNSILTNESKEESTLEIPNFESGFFLDLNEFMDSESETRKKLGKIKNEKITNLNTNDSFLKKIQNLLNGKYIKITKILFSGGVPLYLFFQKINANKDEKNKLETLKKEEEKQKQKPEIEFNFPKIDNDISNNGIFESNFFDKTSNEKINNEEKVKNSFIEKILSGEKIVNNFYHLNEDIKNEILKVLSKNDSFSLNKLFTESTLEKIYSYNEKVDKKITIYFCNKEDGNFKFELENENGKNFLRPTLIKNMVIIGIDKEE